VRYGSLGATEGGVGDKVHGQDCSRMEEREAHWCGRGRLSHLMGQYPAPDKVVRVLRSAVNG